MKKVILYIILFLTFILFTSCSENTKQEKIPIDEIVTTTEYALVAGNMDNNQINQGYLYRDLGRYRYNYPDGTYIQMHSYIWKRLNRTGYYPQFKYEYVLTAVSESYNGTRTAETWLYYNRIFYAGNEISYHQFPNGITTYVQTTPTAVYSWFTSDENISAFGMSWGNAVYENR